MFRVFTLAPIVALSLAVTAESAIAGIVIKIDKAEQVMTVSRDGETLHRWPVSTGRGSYDTPGGNFTAFRMEAEHYSKEWDDAPMPHSIFFTARGHAIHGTYETRRLGAPASHGCVRLAPANARTLFSLVKAEGLSNTKVTVTGSLAMYARRPAAETTAARRQPRRTVRTAEQHGREREEAPVYRRARPAYQEPTYAQQPRGYYYVPQQQPQLYYPQPYYPTVGYPRY